MIKGMDFGTGFEFGICSLNRPVVDASDRNQAILPPSRVVRRRHVRRLLNAIPSNLFPGVLRLLRGGRTSTNCSSSTT